MEDIKQELYISDYDTLYKFKDLFISLFYEIVDNITYYKKYTFDSMHKTTSLIVLLSGIIIHNCINTKNDFQMLSESKYF